MVKDTFERPLRDLRISVTDRCNFRCPYCMPAEIFGERYEFLPRKELLTFEEISRLAQIFVRLGVNKVRLTGGEPLVRKNLEKLVYLLTQIDGIEDLTLTTNGFLLEEQAQALKEAGLRRVTVSLDSLDDQVFGQMNGRNFGVAKILDGILKAEQVGLHPIKINAVVHKGINDHTILDLIRHFKGTGHIVRMIEFMDVGTLNDWKMAAVVPSTELVQRINTEFPLEPLESHYRGEVAERYRYKDGTGEIGFISSVTEPFCGDCTRGRLSPEVKVFTCLFAGDGTDLRGPLRSGATDKELEEIVENIWLVRTDRYSELRTALTQDQNNRPKVEMFRIGG